MQLSINPFFRVFFISVSVLLILAGTSFGKGKKSVANEKSSLTPAVVAMVNGTAITRPELDRAVKIMLSQNNGGKTLSGEERKMAEKSVLDQLIAAELLYQAGQKLPISDVDKKVDAQVNQNKAKFTSQEVYEKALKENGLTESDLRLFARKEIFINNLIEKEIASRVNISDADVKKFYDENIDKFKHEETVKASHILVGVDSKASDEDKKKAKEKAEALLKRVKGGEDFAEVAKKESSCPSSVQGGDLGYFSKGQMVPAFENAAFSLNPGEISGLVETQYGYHIIKMVDRKPAGTDAFDDVKGKIRSYLQVQEIQKGIGDYIEKLRKEGTVEVKLS